MTTGDGHRGMVTSPHFHASEAGLRVLKQGGSAVEAAVCVAATLAVVYPHMTGIGGDSFWLIKSPDGQLMTINACGAASQNVSLETYKAHGHNTIPFRGPLAAITVAGTISGWQKALALSKSTLPLESILEEAIHYADHGVSITQGGADIALQKDEELGVYQGYSDVFRPNGHMLAKNQTLTQTALADTLRQLSKKGLQDFYHGTLARTIVADLQAVGSPLDVQDFENHQPALSPPLKTKLANATLYNTTAPSQGFVSLLILALLDRLNIDYRNPSDHIHHVVEATKQAFKAYKTMKLGDPAYMQVNPQLMLDDQQFLQGLINNIDTEHAMPWPEPGQNGDTTWFGVMDEKGWSVSAIQSTYFEFGSGIVLPQSGIVWQNRGASFVLREEGWNVLRAGRKPFHTLNPAYARFNDGRELVYGTMGGDGQPQTQAAIFSRYAYADVPLQEAISAPRWLLGRTWGDESTSLKIENDFAADVYDKLIERGHNVERISSHNPVMGHAGAIVRLPDGSLQGGTDPRSDGKVAAC